MSPGLECDLRNIDVETVSDIVVEAEYMLVSHNFAPERANQTYFKISVILSVSLECICNLGWSDSTHTPRCWGCLISCIGVVGRGR